MCDICDIDSTGGQVLSIFDRRANVEDLNLLTSALFSWANQNGLTKALKRFLSSDSEECAGRFEMLCVQSIARRSYVNFIAYDKNCPPDCIDSFSDSFETVLIAND